MIFLNNIHVSVIKISEWLQKIYIRSHNTDSDLTSAFSVLVIGSI